MSKVAFTGTTKGPTGAQLEALWAWMVRLPGANELHHGMAEGADEAAHLVARDLGWRVVGYPGVNKRGEPAGRASLAEAPDVVLPERPYLKRNRDIVAGASVLLAVPSGYTELGRGSGTWATVRYARQAGVPVVLFWPDGTVTEEGM